MKNTSWKCDRGRQIKQACSNQRQVVLNVNNDQLIYFELDAQSSAGLLVDKGQKLFKQSVCCLHIAPVPEGRVRFKFLLAGFGDSTVRVLSLEPETCLERVSVQALPSPPVALLVT